MARALFLFVGGNIPCERGYLNCGDPVLISSSGYSNILGAIRPCCLIAPLATSRRTETIWGRPGLFFGVPKGCRDCRSVWLCQGLVLKL